MTVRIPLNASTFITGKYANRHGLIAGATGTGKTVTLMKMAEEFSRAGVPVFVADVKGDIAGLAVSDLPVRLFDVNGTAGEKFSIALPSFGADLLGRILGLTEPQQGMIETLSDTVGAPQSIDDLHDQVQRFEGMNATSQAVRRKITRFANNGGRKLTEGRTFDLQTLMPFKDGKGQIAVLDAQELVMTPEIYGTVMLWLLREVYARFPEAGDCDRPKFVMFIDEAHLLFQDAPAHLIHQIEQTARLVRSKGVGIYFATQSPEDLPAAVAGQLAHRIQHGLRGSTVRDQRAIRAAAETMPINPSIDAAEAIGKLGIGEALVSVLDASGLPTPCQRVRIDMPRCRLGALSDSERSEVMDKWGYVKEQPQLPVSAAGSAASEIAYGLFGLALIFGGIYAVIT